jgi:imidazoleglycerol-phosphate dehydratase/histidinol-phosphatase
MPLAHQLLDAPRIATVCATPRKPAYVRVDLDRVAEPKVHTGLGFFDHMLEQIGKHGGFALQLSAMAIRISMSTTPSRTARSRWVRR